MSLQNTTESEDDGIGKSTTVTQETMSCPPVRSRAFSDTNVPSDTDGSHIAKAGYVYMHV